MAAGAEADVLLRQYVQEALAAKASGGSTKLYDQLVSEVKRLRAALRGPAPAAGAQHPPAADPAGAAEQLVALLRGLGACVSLVHERRHELLLKELLDVPLWQVPQALRLALLDWVGHVVVANGALVQSCLQTLVYSLLPPPGPPLPDPNPGEAWQPAEGQTAIQDEVLAATEKVLSLVPTAGSRLLPLVVGNFPHKLRDRNTQCLYLRGVFALAEGPSGGAVREGLLAGVVDHLIGIDVEIRWEDIAEAAAEEERREEEGGLPQEEEPDIFELEGMSELDLANGGSGSGSGDDSPRPATRGGWEGGHALTQQAPAAGAPGTDAARPAVDETADKLDSMMELTFQHLERRGAAGQLGTAWDTLLGAFERSVLLTHRSKFTQFLLFYACRQQPEQRCRTFLHLLLARLTDRQQPPIARAACAAYAASFLARAAFCPEALVVESLQRMADWCLRYARDEDRRGGLPPIPSSNSISMMSADAQVRHGAFYAACQALLYVLCYHMEPLLRPKHKHHQQHAHSAPASLPNGGLAAGVAERQQAAQHGAAGVPGSLGASGGTPASMDGLPSSLRSHERRDAVHAQREACADAVRALFSGPMPHLLRHALDPLSSCARSVVAEFGRQARMLGFAELAKLVKEWERRQHAASKQHRQLELFFPFDPYLLRRSAAHLALPTTYIRWRRGHPSGAVRAQLESESSSDSDREDLSDSELSELEEGAAAAGVAEESSSSDDDSDSSSSSGSSSGYDSSSESDADDLKRTRFGSIPGSSFGSDYRARKRPHLPGALKTGPGLFGGIPATSPTMGFAVPHHGSLSSGGSPPYGLSPAGPPPPTLFGGGSGGLHAFGAPAPGGLHLGLANGPGRP
ncbi:RNA polymerase I-specific transcription initiation factor RRN3-like [Chlorella sorokiniana]|uniref:RNA polymerase I-specific transcription initiation factor RRN3-like n=1 Tax=Chlorella sorokiniana TaxID=3076 RepID=A0A2P6TIK1_CHLSO|nr:RNA polymerase I-specific transcription initiation factor RRN3-like [Chlorella sorokiniana]|eukprot:PRW34096.1 RNA polymerase I-specific transcription initiation factor RRN3-like [Chlorella sorokiniana]